MLKRGGEPEQGERDGRPPGKRLVRDWTVPAEPMGRGEALGLAVLVFLVLCGAWILRLRGVPGEADFITLLEAARAWVDRYNAEWATSWKTSPLYVWFIAVLYQLGLSSTGIVEILGKLSMFVAAATLVALHLLWRRLFSVRVSFASLVATLFMPSFFWSGLVGFPTGLATFALLCGLLAFLRWSDEPSRWWRAVLGVLCFVVAIGIKADVLLLSPVMGLLLWRPPFSRAVKQTAVVATTVAFGVGLNLLMARFFAQESRGTMAVVNEWDQQWGWSLAALTETWNVSVLEQSAGIALLLGTFIVAVGQFATRDYRKTSLLILTWWMPTFLFWGFRDGNSTRHMLGANLVLAPGGVLLVGLLVERWAGGRRGAFVVGVAALLGINFFAGDQGHDINFPGARLDLHYRRVTSLLSSRVLESLAVVDGPEPKRALQGDYHMIRYMEYAVTQARESGREIRGTVQTFWVDDSKRAELEAQGWTIYPKR